MKKSDALVTMVAIIVTLSVCTNLFADDQDIDEDGFSVEQWDCDDFDSSVHPEAFEVCRDGIDQNCDGIDLLICLEDAVWPHVILTRSEPITIPDHLYWFMDGNENSKIDMQDAVHALYLSRELGGGPGRDFDGDGYTAADGDRNDADPGVYPGAPEICGDTIDQDCDGVDQLCPEDLDTDGDQYTPAAGDCNDQSAAVFPGAEDEPGDNLDQDCDGCDALFPGGTGFVNEMFTEDEGGFILFDNYSVSGGRLIFTGADQPYVFKTLWNGGNNPSNSFSPLPQHSNYFGDYHLSVGTKWLSGGDTYRYGVFLSSQENPVAGGIDYLMFVIRKSGYFSIYEYKDGFWWIEGDYSFLLTRTTEPNRIAVDKEGNNFRFYIDDLEVKRLTIEGYEGGGVGIITSDYLDVAYDNFEITDPVSPTCQPGEFPLYAVKDQNEFLYRLMTSVYLWYDEVPVIDYSIFTSPEQLLEDLKYGTFDKWSYITTKEDYDSHYEEGKYIGYGFSYRFDQNNDLRISFVYKDSPAEIAGMRRGDKVLAINETPVSVIDRYDLWSSILGDEEIGVSAKMLLESPQKEIKNIVIEKALVDEKTVLHHEIIEQSGKKTGYLVFKGFIEPSRGELEDVFTVFKNEGIDELIVDLRYNGGGRLSVANYLASLIGGVNASGEIFMEMIYNDMNQHRNYSYIFSDEPLTLSLDRVFIITTRSTASASESVIVGLKPFVETVVIGETTRGKPVGSSTFDMGDRYISAIQFKVSNAAGEQEYFDGLSPACQAEDGLTYAFGHLQEPSLKTALEYISSGQCPGLSSKRAAPRTLVKSIADREGLQAEIGAF